MKNHQKMDHSMRRYQERFLRRSNPGFTLLEILIALFIFSIISVILAGALRTVISAESGTERNAARLRQLQFALLIFSRDVEQVLDRPVLGPTGKPEATFIGTPRAFTFTHGGLADSLGDRGRSSLQRTRYSGEEGMLWRYTWQVLDQAPSSQPLQRALLDGVSEVSFRYLNKEGKWQSNWPSLNNEDGPLPRAVQIQLMLSKWGKINQTYAIPVRSEVKN